MAPILQMKMVMIFKVKLFTFKLYFLDLLALGLFLSPTVLVGATANGVPLRLPEAQLCQESLSKKAPSLSPLTTPLLELTMNESSDTQQLSRVTLLALGNLQDPALAQLKIDRSQFKIPDYGYQENLIQLQLTLDLATRGYRLLPDGENSHFGAKIISTLIPKSSKRPLEFKLTKDLPVSVIHQAQTLAYYLKGESCCKSLNPNNREDYSHSANPKFKRLTKDNLDQLEPGIYSYVLLTNEFSMRIGFGHHYIGERRPVYAAGDISINRDPVTQTNVIESLNPRSDTYHPLPLALIPALLGLWRQGIFPENIQLLNWDNSPSPISFDL